MEEEPRIGVIETLSYKRVGTVQLKLLIAKPKGWTSGEPEQFVRHCRMMAERGAVAFSVEYRLLESSDNRSPNDSGEISASSDNERIRTAALGFAECLADCLADCEDAVRYIRERSDELGIDPNRIVAAGDSAGGYLAACLGTMEESVGGNSISPQVNAVINCNGIVDLTGKWRSKLQPASVQGNESDEEAVRVWYDMRETAMRLSPLFRVRAGLPPSLTIHGLLDRTVEPEQAVRFVEAHRACGNEAQLVLLPRFKHAFILFDYTALEDETMLALSEIELFLRNIGLLGGESDV
jgi:acetyl esterase